MNLELIKKRLFYTIIILLSFTFLILFDYLLYKVGFYSLPDHRSYFIKINNTTNFFQIEKHKCEYDIIEILNSEDLPSIMKKKISNRLLLSDVINNKIKSL